MQETKETTEKSPTEKDAPSANEKDPEERVSDGQYYYDDAHGYEDFDPDAADEDENK
jgi:hypothetical protein